MERSHPSCGDVRAKARFHYAGENEQLEPLDAGGRETASLTSSLEIKTHCDLRRKRDGCFQIQSRRYLGNKYKLVGFIKSIVFNKCGDARSLCDIFAGTGVVGECFNDKGMKIISNDFLFANYVCLRSFLSVDDKKTHNAVSEKIKRLNDLPSNSENYFSENFGGTYFSEDNARKIGAIREEIERISESENEKSVLLCSLLYAADRAANTVGHYDAFRKKMDMLQPIHLLQPDISYQSNTHNEVYREDANALASKVSCDVLYIDPPYNSRQYSDAYHLLENLIEWKKPGVLGVGKKMDRSHIKSKYCLKDATSAFADLIGRANCKYILLSYNNTGSCKDSRSNARMNDKDIVRILARRGDVEIFEKRYRAFTTGKSDNGGNVERVFYCKVRG